MLKAEPVESAAEFFDRLFRKWRRNTSYSKGYRDDGEGEATRRHRLKIVQGTEYMYKNEGFDDASKIYERGNDG